MLLVAWYVLSLFAVGSRLTTGADLPALTYLTPLQLLKRAASRPADPIRLIPTMHLHTNSFSTFSFLVRRTDRAQGLAAFRFVVCYLVINRCHWVHKNNLRTLLTRDTLTLVPFLSFPLMLL